MSEQEAMLTMLGRIREQVDVLNAMVPRPVPKIDVDQPPPHLGEGYGVDVQGQYAIQVGSTPATVWGRDAQTAALIYLRGLEGDRLVFEQLHDAVVAWMDLVKPADYEQMQDERHRAAWANLAMAEHAAKAHLHPSLPPHVAAFFEFVEEAKP